MQHIYRSLLAFCLLLTLVGQAVASVSMSCEMPHMSQTQPAQGSDMHHDMSAGTMNMDCCEGSGTNQECSCPVSACSTHSVLSADRLFTSVSLSPEKVRIYIPQSQAFIASSLYRPPMSA